MSALTAREGPTLSTAEYDEVRALIYRNTGMSFGPEKVAYVSRRVLARMAETGSDFRRYVTLLRCGGALDESQALINLLTVNETYFLREEYQFHCLTRELLDEVAARSPDRRLRIASLCCSTGEEPYSIAMFVLDRWAPVDTFDIEIVAADIDSDVLAHARQGVYGERALQNVPPEMRARYFVREALGRYRVCAALRESVAFERVNIHAARELAALGRFDVVFCRNALIYFDDPSRRAAVSGIWDALNPGGFLALGHSESLSRITTMFRLRRFPDAIVYQRPE
jgi:chemotaxis protein methyltransferase CheR